MASTSMQSKIASGWKYDVFLSFRGEDTRKNFTGHLYSALDQKGIFTFKDNHRLERGKVISSELFKAIKESRFALVVFSENYASSTWCLDELAKILECMKAMGQIVLPVFYNVTPSEVRKQSGSFEKAFRDHEKNFREALEKVQSWRVAMTKIANISGWHLGDREESKFIQGIVDEISNKLSSTFLNTNGNLVGMESRMKQMGPLLGIGLNDVRMLGICGMGGIGKTTLTRSVFDKICDQFDGSSFLADIREVSITRGLLRLQKQLISEIFTGRNINICNVHNGSKEIMRRLRHKRVLVILDDVDQIEQLKALAGMHDWFGLGSRIIITTRNRNLLVSHGVDNVHMVNGLNPGEALKLFCWKAFRNCHPTIDYLELSQQMVDYADGLPLALEVLGSFLFGRSKAEWKGALDRLKEVPDERIFEILKISYDGLQELEKKIFLDVACFFEGRDQDEVRRILDNCDFYPDIGISVLIDKCIISLSINKLHMHDLMKCMGREIVRQQGPTKPGQRSRLWLSDDVYRVLTKNEGTEAVEGIILDFPAYEELKLNAKSFSGMRNLRLLKIKDVSLCQSLEYLSDELRLLNWHGCPLTSLPSSFQPNKLFELNMCYSHIKQLWEGVKHLNQLKIIILSHSKYLTGTPDFTGAPNLEKLILDGCTSLSFLHPSVGLLRKLILLNLKDCKQLRSLRAQIECESVEVLILSGCSKLNDVQGIFANAKHLLLLLLDGTAIKELPSSIQHLTRLITLDLRDCRNLISLPNSICDLRSLKVLNIKGCSKLDNLPDDLGHLASLENLDLGGTAIRELPSSIQHLTRLITLGLRDCRNLISLPNSICDLRSLKVLNSSGCSKLHELPDNLGHLVSLENLDLGGTAISQPPSSIVLLTNLQQLSFNGCKGEPRKSGSSLLSLFPLFSRENPESVGLRLPSFLSGLCSLRHLDLGDCNLQEGAIPSDIGSLPSLLKLNLSRNNFVSLPSSISQLPKLETLFIEYCDRLQALPELPASTGRLFAQNCTSLEIISSSPHIFKSKSRNFYLNNCFKLAGSRRSSGVTVSFYKSMLHSLLKSQFQRLNIGVMRSEFEIIVPGSQVPDWFFDYYSGGSSLRIGQRMIRCRGLALCAAFSVHNPKDFYPYKWMQLGCTVQTDITHTHAVSCTPCSTPKTCFSSMSAPLNSLAGTDHLWLFYISLSHLASNDIFYLRDVSFRYKTDESVKVKECGLRPVYDSDSDIEELIGASNNLSSNTSREVLDPDRLAVTSSIIKRSRDCCPDQQPYPKRLK